MGSFNLIDEKWIPCLMLHNSEYRELGLFDTLNRAHEIKEITDNSPLVVVSLHRLLLAILHRNVGPKNFDAWTELWKKGRWDSEKVRSYFDQWRNRFYLLDDERPFYQYPEVLKKGGKEADLLPVEILMQECASGNNPTLFDHSSESGNQTFPAGLVARYLVARQAYSFGGGVSFPFNLSHGPLVSGFSAIAKGGNLFETLAMNLVVYHRNKPIPMRDDNGTDDVPFWERKTLVQAAPKDKAGTPPLGYLDYLTWQSRRIRLIRDPNDIEVIACQLQQNFKLTDDPLIFDPFKVYIKGEKGFYSLGLREEKGLWRNSHTIVMQADAIDGRSSLFTHLAKIQTMIGGKEISAPQQQSISIFGVISDKANVKLWSHERLPISLAYFNSQNLRDQIEMSIRFAEEVSERVLRSSEKLMAEALNTSAERLSLRPPYWANVERGFYALLSALPDMGVAGLKEWFRFVDQASRQALEKTFRSLSGSAREQKAIVDAENGYYKVRRKLLDTNAQYREYLSPGGPRGGAG